MLVKFQDSYNTRRWGGLYTNAKHWANGHVGVKDQGAYKISNRRVG